jgi:hypothetical protein
MCISQHQIHLQVPCRVTVGRCWKWIESVVYIDEPEMIEQRLGAGGALYTQEGELENLVKRACPVRHNQPLDDHRFY